MSIWIRASQWREEFGSRIARGSAWLRNSPATILLKRVTMTAKKQAEEVLKLLPEDCSMEQIQYHLYVAQKVAQRLATADQQPPIPHEEVKERLAQWIIK